MTRNYFTKRKKKFQTVFNIYNLENKFNINKKIYEYITFTNFFTHMMVHTDINYVILCSKFKRTETKMF